MAFNYIYPTAVELFRIQPDLEKRADADRLGMQLFPRTSKNTLNVRWFQKDNTFGLMNFRGLDGAPGRVRRLGDNGFDYEAGVYGDFQEISERELMLRASPLNPETRIPITDLIMEANNQLVQREADRYENNVFSLLTTGTLSIPSIGPNGVAVYSDTYAIQKFSSTIPWTSFSTATPIADLQTIQQLSVGHSGRFDASSTLYVNQFTANALINNANNADLNGRRGQYGSTLNNLPGISSYFQSQNLPGIAVYDEGYQLAANNGPLTAPLLNNLPDQFQKFIPNHIGILIGKRPAGETVGEYITTINAYAPNQAAASVAFVKDSFTGVNAPREVPGKIQVYRLTNGGPAIYYPNAVVAITV